jgi:hypothetical protein
MFYGVLGMGLLQVGCNLKGDGTRGYVEEKDQNL